MANPRKILFLDGRPIGQVQVDGQTYQVIPDRAFLYGLQHTCNLIGGDQGILPDFIAGGSAYGIVYIGPIGGLTSLTPLTDGQVIIGSAGAAPVAGSITGTTNQVTVTSGAGTITLSTPQNTHTGATPTFAGLTISGQTANTVYAGPTSGGAGNAAFRALVSADMPNGVGTGTETVTTVQFDKADTTLANVTGLSVNVVAGATYQFKAVLHVTADAVGGHKYAIGGTATATGITYQVNSISNTAGAFVINSRQTAMAGPAGQAGATTPYTEIVGTIVVNAAGTLTAQFAQNAANGTSSVLARSAFNVTRVS